MQYPSIFGAGFVGKDEEKMTKKDCILIKNMI